MNSANLTSRVGLALLATVAVAVVPSCTGGSKGDRDNRGDFKVTRISTGRGSIYPYRIRTVDSFGNPTTTVVNIESVDTLRQNVNGNNGVLPVSTFDTSPVLPDGNPGNQFIHFTFSHKLEITSILSDLLANQTNSGLTTAVNIVAYDPATEESVTVAGRGFVNGYTYYNRAGVLDLVQAVEADGSDVAILAPEAAGFPSGFSGAEDLVSNKSFVFVADSDDDLNTFETFPDDKLIRIVVSNAVIDSEGGILQQEVCTATTVGADPNPPEVLGYSPDRNPQITPGNGQTGADPSGDVVVRFNKPVQPGDVGAFFDPIVFTPPTGGITLSVTAAAQTFQVIYFADPLDYSNLCDYRVRPAYSMPGSSRIDITVQNTAIRGLDSQLLGNAISTFFTTSQGPGLVNAPVAPEAIYVGLGGAEPGVSIIDLNGFGQGTGDLSSTRFPLNPNIGQPGVTPPLAPGTSNLDAGSGGVLTLVKDTNLNTRLVRDPMIGSVTDIHIGPPLDLVFNNENINVNATRANQTNPILGLIQPGNTITEVPHPNPPRLVFPPPNPNRAIFGEEPTSAGGLNLLVPGNPFSSQLGELGVFGTLNSGVFNGPAPPPLSPPPPPMAMPFSYRQQIGHFLYVLDSDNRQIIVLNSNRMTVLDTIRLSDPVDLSFSPSLTRLAVANFASSTVSFIDTNPYSQTFHQIVGETRVERGPAAVSWQPDGEDILVISRASSFLTIISARDFTARRSVAGFLNDPIDIAVTPRFVATGFAQGLYFAYVLNSNGTVAIYESGPDGVNGIGFNNMIGTVPNETFPRAQAIRYDYASQNGALLIGHVDPFGLGQVSRLDMTSSPGVTPISSNSGGFILPPTFRQKEWGVTQRFGGVNPTTPVSDLLSGNSIIDLAVDDMINNGADTGQISQFNTGLNVPPWQHSGKDAIKAAGNAIQPKLLFVALSDVGKIDVMELNTGRKIASIDAPDVRVVASYWRQ